jgi:hypothetical protein
MKERPILFSAPMVRALLAGRKTQTRRVVSERAKSGPRFNQSPDVWVWIDGVFRSLLGGREHPVACPYGAPGDRLWVRETWRPYSWHEDNPIGIEFAADGARMEDLGALDATGYEHWYERVVLSCTEECQSKGLIADEGGNYSWSEGESPLRWRLSIHMPRWASRITLEITQVRAERVQEISEADAIAEGCAEEPVTTDDIEAMVAERFDETAALAVALGPGTITAKGGYAFLWDQINGERPGCAWSDNPWVWVVEFKQVHP